ncbi:hypothetical protein [Mammaliicoccus sciuri]|uniref:hypothetical protein n=1 Tax=Mammaliicoccus sciuri TaxID=1296 RepID=UPI0021D27D38|nr:hypothetical protein [Mammaliicoccus sciuri]UXV31245.1 hypothetical protein MUA60_09725 [Mammaliicoccus sciuri]
MNNEVFNMMRHFRGSFINYKGELILDLNSNSYFIVKDCKTKLDLVVKFVHYISRDCIKGTSAKTQKKLQNGFCEYINKNNSVSEFENMYQVYGNGLSEDTVCEYARKLVE